jgi:DNA repair protein RadC
MSICKWVVSERPREMLAEKGPNSLNNSKLLAILLRTGYNNKSAEELAREILNKYENIRNIDSVSITELKKIKGIGLAKASQIKAALELGKRMYCETNEKSKITSTKEAIEYTTRKYSSLLFSNKEHFCAVFLNQRNYVIGDKIFNIGTSTEVNVNPREILKEAIELDASAIILLHNHPSGDVQPSRDDELMTENFKKGSEMLGIYVLDHIILGKEKGTCYSVVRKTCENII